ncbi:MAG: hypothetical protein IM473_21290 [Microcystis sp. M015S2]|jgi:hypothetical protein|uniref:hypothetical protein n=1 Tax=Microcystis TaxID=1125 RepID=UPI00133026C7|nr:MULTISPECIES: hypothetical protein [Microcystis]MCA2710142.1 hypothetical protein [Microcystis sp. M025S2]MCA2744841.1 hypothetical protein [Microcystis sp. M015S2]MCA2760381.1 hypothetical protein [Microcystis sp. M145S2]WNF14830.1 hypothetical protein RKE53_23010 [Microcystis aeruginosa NRERC-214]
MKPNISFFLPNKIGDRIPSEKVIAVTDNEVIIGLCSLTQVTGSAIAPLIKFK